MFFHPVDSTGPLGIIWLTFFKDNCVNIASNIFKFCNFVNLLIFEKYLYNTREEYV